MQDRLNRPSILEVTSLGVILVLTFIKKNLSSGSEVLKETSRSQSCAPFFFAGKQVQESMNAAHYIKMYFYFINMNLTLK
jgi:hypothetical protein